MNMFNIRPIAVLSAVFISACAVAQERYVLTSVKQNVRVANWDFARDGCSITKKTLHGGKQEGVELITIDNGKLQIDVIPTRGMSIYEVRSGDMRLGWDSPVEEIVHPSLVDLESRGGLGWLEGFNEFMVRCGLEFAGHPGTDEFINNTGDTATMDLTLHGKVGNIPASEVEVLVDANSPGRVTLRGVVYEKFFYGPKLRLTTELSVAVNADSFSITDTVTNLGASDQEFQIIYHSNFGKPILGQDAKVHVAAKSVSPMNEHAAEAIDGYRTYRGPTQGFVEEVFLIEPLSDEFGKTGAVLVNAAGDRGASMAWSVNELPYLTLWKNTAAEQDGYVTGIEPATGYPYNRMIEREAGRVPKLRPGESRRFSIEFGLHLNPESVATAVKSISDLQTMPAEVIRKPPA